MVGGDRLTFDNKTATPVANPLEAKLISNSTISTKNAKFLTADIKDFFLSSTMEKPEFMKIRKDEIPKDILSKYNMHKIVSKHSQNWKNCKKCCFGIPYNLVHKKLKKSLKVCKYLLKKILPNYFIGILYILARPKKEIFFIFDLLVIFTSKT